MPLLNDTVVSATPTDKDGTVLMPGAIHGGMGEREGPLRQPVVAVREITEAEELIERRGGNVVLNKLAVGVGRTGHLDWFKVPETNVFGLYQISKEQCRSLRSPPPRRDDPVVSGALPPGRRFGRGLVVR